MRTGSSPTPMPHASVVGSWGMSIAFPLLIALKPLSCVSPQHPRAPAIQDHTCTHKHKHNIDDLYCRSICGAQKQARATAKAAWRSSRADSGVAHARCYPGRRIQRRGRGAEARVHMGWRAGWILASPADTEFPILPPAATPSRKDLPLKNIKPNLSGDISEPQKTVPSRRRTEYVSEP